MKRRTRTIEGSQDTGVSMGEVETPESDVVRKLQAQQKFNEIIGGGQTSFAQIMLEDTSLPQEVREMFPVFGDKEISLTNLSKDEQIATLRLMFEDCVNDYYLFTPHYEQTADVERKINLIRAKFYVKLLRSTGGNQRERALYQMITTSQERPPQVTKSGGITGWFKRRVV